MTVTVSNVLNGGGATSGGTNISASWTPDGTSQYLLTVSAYVSTGSVVPVASGVTGNGLTWTPITHVAGDNTGADRTVQYLFVAPSGGSVGGFTISWSTAPTKASWVLDKVAGADAGFGSGTLPQAAVTGTSSGANPSPSSPLGALQSGSVTYASACFESSAGTLGAGTGYTALGQNTSQSLAWTISEWNSAGSTTATATNSTTTNRHSIILIEVPAPATGPTITPFQTSDWTGTTTPKTITVTGALTGDKIVVLYGGDNGGGGFNVSDATASTTGGSTSAWTEPEEGLAASGQAWISSSTADVTADGTVTVSLSRTQSTGQQWGGMALLAHNHGGIGVHARSAPSATETVSLAVAQDSAVALLAIDWDALATVAFSPSGAVDVHRSFDTNLTNYAGYWRGQAAGTRGYGIATSSTTDLHIIAIEVLAASGGVTGTVAATEAADSSTASGQLGYSGASAATETADTSTATGTVVNPVTGTAALVQASQTATASGQLGYSGTSTANQANQTASASGQLGYSGTSARTQANQTATASGQLGYSGTVAASQAAETSTASGTFTGVGFSGSAAVTQAANTASAAGQLGYSGSAAANQAANTSAASGKLGYSGSAAAAQANQSAAANGQLGYSGSAAASQAAQTSSASGTYTSAGSFTGAAAATQANQTASASGQLGYSGTAAPSQANNTPTASGTVVNPITGTAAVVQAGQFSIANGILRYSATGTPLQAANVSNGTGTASGPVTGAGAVFQSDQTVIAVGTFAGLVTSGTATAAVGTAAAAFAAVGPVPHSDPGSMPTPAASAGSMTVPTATGG